MIQMQARQCRDAKYVELVKVSGIKKAERSAMRQKSPS